MYYSTFYRYVGCGLRKLKRHQSWAMSECWVSYYDLCKGYRSNYYFEKYGFNCGSIKNYDQNSKKTKVVHTEIPKLATKNVTFSGFSSGGFKTAYIFNAVPSLIQGVGIINGILGNLQDPVKFVAGRFIDNKVSDIVRWRIQKVAKGLVPGKKAFKGKKVYLQTGKKDFVVTPARVKNTAKMFRKLGCQVKFRDTGYHHIFPSIVKGVIPCNQHTSYAVKNCANIDTAGDMWRHIMPFQVKPFVNNWSKFGKYSYFNTKSFQIDKDLPFTD